MTIYGSIYEDGKFRALQESDVQRMNALVKLSPRFELRCDITMDDGSKRAVVMDHKQIAKLWGLFLEKCEGDT